MADRIYLETTVVSYLTAWPSRDLVRAAHQRITQEWWHDRRRNFDLFVSQPVLDEASEGDPAAAADRLQVLDGMPVLDLSVDVTALAQLLVDDVPLPARAAVDALHIALAAVHGMDYLITWNCRHIANAALRSRIEDVCRGAGYEPPVICTPEELLEENQHGA
jgi:hypothetical protein